MLRIADNLQITNKHISGAVEKQDPGPIQDMVRLMEKSGAQAIDINPGPLKRGTEKRMKFFVRSVQDVTQLPDVLGYPVQTVIGLSNLTSGLTKEKGYQKEKLLLEGAYLPMIASAGLTMVLMNIFHEETVAVANACDAIMEQSVFTWETGFY
jgi:5-methyltetrahydrofolate corrinoid/iron sulfur protein methyltransferase